MIGFYYYLVWLDIDVSNLFMIGEFGMYFFYLLVILRDCCLSLNYLLLMDCW